MKRRGFLASLFGLPLAAKALAEAPTEPSSLERLNDALCKAGESPQYLPLAHDRQFDDDCESLCVTIHTDLPWHS